MNQRVVITGLGSLSPNGIGNAAFFDALINGKSGINRISQFDPESLDCQIAGELKGFDSLVWISKKDAPHVSRVVPLAIAAAYEALQTAGINPETLTLEERRRFGVLLGSGGGSIAFIEAHYSEFFQKQRQKHSNVYAIPSNTIGSLSSELSMRYGLKGLSHVISTGCTSSTDAIGYAYHHLQAGRLDCALAGGVDAPITPGTMTGFAQMKVVTEAWNHAPQSASRPFSRDRSGFVLGEGAWLFVLETLEHARARDAKIYAEIKGYGATCDAHHRVRLDESGEEPSRAMQLALAEAQIPASEIQYVNLHGTATQLNDRVETRAIRLAMGKSANLIAASSTKSMIGHPQGASGAAGVATALCAMETGFIPPTINLESPDPECDLDYVPHTARRQAVEWALCNCIGFGSKNSALVLHKWIDE